MTRLVLLGTVLCAVALFAVRHYRVAQPSTVLRAGLVFANEPVERLHDLRERFAAAL